MKRSSYKKLFFNILFFSNLKSGFQYSVVKASEDQEPLSDDIDLEAEFEKNLLNSAVYIISLSMQVSLNVYNFIL